MRRTLAAFVAVIAFAGVAHADDWAVCNQTDDDDASIRACSRIIAAGRDGDEDLATAYNNRALAYDSKGDHDRAVADFDRAIELNPNDAVAYDNRGYVYDAKGDFDRAIADYGKSIELDSGKASTYKDRGLAYDAKGDHDAAIADFDEAIRRAPRDAAAYDDRGSAFEAKEDHKRAIADYDKAIRLDPKKADYFDDRGSAYDAKGDHDLAISDFDRAIELDPNQAEFYNNRGVAYDDKGDHDRAIADFDQAIAIDPDYALAYDNRGFARDATDDHEKAIADYSKAIVIDPSYALAYRDRASTYQAKGDYDRAIADDSQAIRLKPDDGYAYYGRADAYAAREEGPKAVIDYRMAAKLIQDCDPWHAQALTRITELERHLAAVEPKKTPANDDTASADDASATGVRVALVIGNSAYAQAGRLANPQKDAAAIAAALRSDGFTVTEADNVSRADFLATLNQFAETAAKADWATIYFAGHGLQLGGVNYLVPVDARLAADRDVPDQAIELDRVLDAVSGAHKFGLIVVDACRNNPFLAEMQFTSQARAARTRGLARVVTEGTTLVEFSARDGQEALDGDDAGNSPFAAIFVKLLATPGLEVGKLLREVRADVLDATDKQQEPMFSGNIPPDDMFFRPS